MPPEPGGEGREDWYGAIPLGTKQNWGLGVVKRGGWRKDDLFHFLNLKDLFFLFGTKKSVVTFRRFFIREKVMAFLRLVSLEVLSCGPFNVNVKSIDV